MATKRLLAILMACVCTLVIAPAAQAAEDPANPDAAAYAKAVGVTISEANLRLGLQEVAGGLEATLRKTEPETFAGLFIDHRPSFRIVVMFTKAPAESIAPYLDQYPIADYIEPQMAEYSISELESERSALADRFKDTRLTLDIDMESNRVLVEVPVGTSLRDEDVDPEELPKMTKVVEGVTPAEPAANIYGGLTLSTCTSGFAVHYGSNTSNRGVTTAGHCSNSQSFGGSALTYQGDDVHSGNTDAQSHKLSGGSYPNWIRVGADGATRTVTGRTYWAGQTVGDFVCHYGMVTHYGCGFIVSKNAPGCVDSPGSNYIKVDSDPDGAGFDLAQSGDSGGPWFVGHGAWGTMSCQQGYDAIYSSIGYTEVGLGVHVLTAP